MKRTFIILYCSVFLASACKKEEPRPDWNFFQGQVLYDCNGIPFANQRVTLFQDFGDYEWNHFFYTDHEGSFTHVYDLTGDKPVTFGVISPKINQMEIYADIINNVPPNSQAFLGKIYIRPWTKAYLNISAYKPGNPGDSVVVKVSGYNTETFVFHHPFHDSILGPFDIESYACQNFTYKGLAMIGARIDQYTNGTHTERHFSSWLRACPEIPDTLDLRIL